MPFFVCLTDERTCVFHSNEMLFRLTKFLSVDLQLMLLECKVYLDVTFETKLREIENFLIRPFL